MTITKKLWYIFDLDNCIADDRWRQDRLPNPHPTFISFSNSDPRNPFFAYHSLSPFDGLVNGGEVLERCPRVDGKLIGCAVITARPVLWHVPTLEWFRRKLAAEPEILIMRNPNDHRPSVDMKRAAVGSLVNVYDVPADSIVAAYDDRDDILRMYRSIGISARKLDAEMGGQLHGWQRSFVNEAA